MIAQNEQKVYNAGYEKGKIEGGGGGKVTIQEKNITGNGNYTPDAGFDGFSKVSVNVGSSGGGSSDLIDVSEHCTDGNINK